MYKKIKREALETLQYYSTVCVCVCESIYVQHNGHVVDAVCHCVESTPSLLVDVLVTSLLKLKRQSLSTFTLLDPRGQCSVRGCRESATEQEVLLLSTITVGSACCFQGAQKISPKFLYYREKGNIYLYMYVD